MVVKIFNSTYCNLNFRCKVKSYKESKPWKLYDHYQPGK